VRRGGLALVTGGAGAIGSAIARALVQRDPRARVAVVDVDGSRAAAVAADLGERATSAAWDLSEPAALDASLDALQAALGEIDLLVNNAGIMEVRSVAATPWALAERLLRIDLESPLRLMARLAPAMAARGHGAIVNVSSLAGTTPLRGCAYYGAAKAGLAMASEIAHLELAPRGVHVMTVYPGPVRSPLERRAREQYGGSWWSRVTPAGDAGALAARIVGGLDRRAARVVYPPLYAWATRFPTIATSFARAFAPSPAE
jgi:short-subunit dehydrogenase